MLTTYIWILFFVCSVCCGEGYFYGNGEHFDDEEEIPDATAASLSGADITKECRFSGGRFFKPVDFTLFTCAYCYQLILDFLFNPGMKFIRDGYLLKNNITGETYVPDISNRSSPIWQTFAVSKGERLWEDCCKAAEKCCDVMRKTPKTVGVHCPRTWDGWNCWPDIFNGTRLESSCPHHVYFYNDPPRCTRFAKKTCMADGTWFRLMGNEWTNFTTCSQRTNLRVTLNIHIITTGISIACLIPALIIFFYYKQLQVLRISMHKNLFTALLLNGVFVIIFQSYFMSDHLEKQGEDSVLVSNQGWCKLFYITTKYFRLCTYMWMFCEGFYLHKLIAAAFTEQKSMVIFYFMGWGFPLIPVTILAIVRLLKANDSCWSLPYGEIEWVINATLLLSLLVNFFFLFDIVRVLVTKLKIRSSNSDEPTQFRRAVKATAVLIPLFGLHFSLVTYPEAGPCWWMTFHTYAIYAVDGMQGAVVSLIFCYLNNEVLYLLKRSYRRRQEIKNVGSHANSRRAATSRGSRGSMSTNADSIVLSDIRQDKSSPSK